MPDMNTRDRIFGLLIRTDISDWTIKAKETGADIIRIYADPDSCDEQFKHWHVAGDSIMLYGSLKHLQISASGLLLIAYLHETLDAGPDSLGRIEAGGATFLMTYDESDVITSCDPLVNQLDLHRKAWILSADI